MCHLDEAWEQETAQSLLLLVALGCPWDDGDRSVPSGMAAAFIPGDPAVVVSAKAALPGPLSSSQLGVGAAKGRAGALAAQGVLQQGEGEPGAGTCCPWPCSTQTFLPGQQHWAAPASGHGGAEHLLEPLCCWQSPRTQGHPPGSSQGRWKLMSPGRRQCWLRVQVWSI